MALRSIGIPAAYAFVPFWGSSNNGHSVEGCTFYYFISEEEKAYNASRI